MTMVIEDVAAKSVPPVEPMYSPYGYVIVEDGSTWAMFNRFQHGLILAFLFPQALADWRDRGDDEEGEGQKLELPECADDVDVFAFQRFELEQHGTLPAIRICPSRMSGEPSVDLPKRCTALQVEALRLVFKKLGYTREQMVHTDEGDVSIMRCLTVARVRCV